MPSNETIARWLGAEHCRRDARIQSLWGGYGEAVRMRVEGGPVDSVVVKEVRPGAGSGRSHARKLRSYAVEHRFYRQHAEQSRARVARLLHAEASDDGWVFVLEDLVGAGFTGRSRRGVQSAVLMMRWLADFHASFLGVAPEGLWPVGTYWHLATRPEEWARMPSGRLKDAAVAIDARLSAVRFQTLVHGDAKPANFCLGSTSAAAVDFQYVGGGCGMKDVAYALWGEPEAEAHRLLDVYFDRLRPQVPDGVEAEWRTLFPWALADFHRFLVGWAPGARVPAWVRAGSESVCRGV